MKRFGLSVLIMVFLASCARATPTPAPEVVMPVESSQAMEQQVVVVKPGIAVEVVTPTPEASPSVEPFYGDIYLTRAEIIPDANGSLPQVRLVGALPSACHKLFIKIDPLDTDKKILIKVFSTTYLPNNCRPDKLLFDNIVVIDGLKPGNYTVWVSLGKIGDITVK
jgi:hypothetical protein